MIMDAKYDKYNRYKNKYDKRSLMWITNREKYILLITMWIF